MRCIRASTAILCASLRISVHGETCSDVTGLTCERESPDYQDYLKKWDSGSDGPAVPVHQNLQAKLVQEALNTCSNDKCGKKKDEANCNADSRCWYDGGTCVDKCNIKPIDCDTSAWLPWEPCTMSCGGGRTQTRTHARTQTRTHVRTQTRTHARTHATTHIRTHA